MLLRRRQALSSSATSIPQPQGRYTPSLYQISPTGNHRSFNMKLAAITTALLSMGVRPHPYPQPEAGQQD